MITLNKSKIPEWLRESGLYQEFIDDDEELFIVDESFFKETSDINSLQDFKRVLKVCDYWMRFLPKSIYKYGTEHYHEVLPSVLEFEEGKNHELSDYLSKKYIYGNDDKIIHFTDYTYLSDEVNFTDGDVLDNRENIEKFYYNLRLLTMVQSEVLQYLTSYSFKIDGISDVYHRGDSNLIYNEYYNHQYSKFKNIFYKDFKFVNSTLKELEDKFTEFLESHEIDFDDRDINEEEWELLHGQTVDSDQLTLDYEKMFKQKRNKFEKYRDSFYRKEDSDSTIFEEEKYRAIY